MKKLVEFVNFGVLFLLIAVCIVGCGCVPYPLDMATANQTDSVHLPIIMYHSILKSRTGKFLVSPSQFERDILALKRNGYEFVLPTDMVLYVKGVANLPKKPVMLTFDDGHYNFLHYALPILKKYNAKAVVNVIGAFSAFSSDSGDSANPNYSHLTWTEIFDLASCSLIEIGNHTYNMHKYNPRYGINKMSGETTSQYVLAVQNDIERLQTKLIDCCKVKPIAFAYPFGKYTKDVQMLLPKLGFCVSFNCNEGVSVIKRNSPNSLFDLKRINRNGSYSTEKLLKKIALK